MESPISGFLPGTRLGNVVVIYDAADAWLNLSMLFTYEKNQGRSLLTQMSLYVFGIKSGAKGFYQSYCILESVKFLKGCDRPAQFLVFAAIAIKNQGKLYE